MAPSTAQAIHPQLLKETRRNGFLALPTEPLQPEEALSSHYLELRFGRPALFSWGRPQDPLDEVEDPPVLPHAVAAVQPRQTSPRIFPPDNREAARRREEILGLARPRRRKRHARSDVFLVAEILGQEEQGDGWESSTSEEEEEESPTRGAARAKGEAETKIVPAEDLRLAMLREVAERVAHGVQVGSLVNINIQDEMAERLWMETRIRGIDVVSPLSHICRVLDAAGHSWWQIDIVVKALAEKLEVRERNELARNAMCAAEFSQFIEDMQQGVVKTQAHVLRFDGYARSSTYQRIVQRVGQCPEAGPELLQAEQEILLRSLRDSVNNLTAVKKVVEDAHRLAYEARAAEGEQLQVSLAMRRSHDATTEFLEDMQDQKEKKSKKLEQDFEVAGRRFGKILQETEELENLAREHERKLESQQKQLESVTEEYREMREKVRRSKRGTESKTNEYFIYKQELEDECDALGIRLKKEQRLLEGRSGLMEGLQRELRDLLMQEVARELEDEIHDRNEKAQARRVQAQAQYEEAQKRLRTADDVLSALNSQIVTGNVLEELMRIKQDVPVLEAEAENTEAAAARDMARFEEIHKWLVDFGQQEVASTARAYVEALKSRVLAPPDIAKAIHANPIHVPFVLHRLLPRRVRAKRRPHPGETKECPESVNQLWLRQRDDGFHRLADAAALDPDAKLHSPQEMKFASRRACPGAWQSPLIRASSAPARQTLERRAASPGPTSGRRSSRRASAASGDATSPKGGSRRKSSAMHGHGHHGPKASGAPAEPESGSVGASLEELDSQGLRLLAAAPLCRFEGGEKVPWDLWQKTWAGLWKLALNVFKALPSDLVVDEGTPLEVGHCVTHLFRDCHQILNRLRPVLSEGTRGLLILQRLEGSIRSADKILSLPSARGRQPRRRKGGPSDEEMEETELQSLADHARGLLTEGREVLAKGLKQQKEKMWEASTLLAKVLSIRKDCQELLAQLRTLAEQHEDLTFACRILAATATSENLIEVESATTSLRRWQRSVQVDIAAAMARQRMLVQDWQRLVVDDESALAALEAGLLDLRVTAALPVVVEESALEVCTAMHCILENRWMRRKVSHMDRRELYDWKKSWKLLKEGNWEPLYETASLPSKESRTENPRLPVSAVMRGGGLPRQDSTGNTRELGVISPELEATMSDLAAELGELGLQGLSLPSSPAAMTPRGADASPRTGARAGRPMLPSRALRQGGTRNLDKILAECDSTDNEETSQPGSQPTSPPGSQPGSPSRLVRGRSTIALGDGSRGEGSRDRFRGGPTSPLSPRDQRRSSDPDMGPLSPENQDKVRQFEDAFAELYQKRLQGAATPQDKLQQADLLDAAYKEMRQNLIESLAPSPASRVQDSGQDGVVVMGDAIFEQEVGIDDLAPYPGPRSAQRRVTSDGLHNSLSLESPMAGDSHEFGLKHSDSFGSSSGPREDSRHGVSDSEVACGSRSASKTPRKYRMWKSRSWAPKGSKRELVSDVEMLELRTPKAVDLPEGPAPSRSFQGRLRGRRRMEPLLLPWKPQDPRLLHLGDTFQPVGRQGEANRCRSPLAVAAPLSQDTEMQRAALINQAPSRGVSPSRGASPSHEAAHQSPTPSRLRSVSPEELEFQRQSMEEVMLPRALSRPSSAPSTVQAAGRFLGLEARSASPPPDRASADLDGPLDETTDGPSAVESAAETETEQKEEEAPSQDDSPSRPALRHYQSREALSAQSQQTSRPPSRPTSRPQSALPDGWRPVTLTPEQNMRPSISMLQAGGTDAACEASSCDDEDEDVLKQAEDAYLDAPLDDNLLRPAGPPSWLRAVVGRANSVACDAPPSQSTEYPDLPGSAATDLSTFAVEQSPSLEEGTPSPWYQWDRPPTSDQLLSRRPPMPSARRPSSTGEAFPALKAQGQRCCASAEVPGSESHRLPPIPGASGEARPSTAQPGSLSAPTTRRTRGPFSADRAPRYRAGTPQGPQLSCQSRAAPDGEFSADVARGRPSSRVGVVARSPAEPGPRGAAPAALVEEGATAKAEGQAPSRPRSASRPPSTPRAGSRSPSRAQERRAVAAEVSDLTRKAASLQRLRMEAPPTLLATSEPKSVKEQAGGPRTDQPCRAERPEAPSVVLAAATAQRQLLMQLKAKVAGARKAAKRVDADIGSAGAWRTIENLLAGKTSAGETKVEEFGPVLSKGLAEKLDPDSGNLATPRKMKLARSQFRSAGSVKPITRGAA